MDDYAYGLAVDGLGNVYVTGGSCDVKYYATIKYNACGEEVWEALYDPNSPTLYSVRAKAVIADSLGNVYVTGEVFEPDSLSATIKYGSSGK